MLIPRSIRSPNLTRPRPICKSESAKVAPFECVCARSDDPARLSTGRAFGSTSRYYHVALFGTRVLDNRDGTVRIQIPADVFMCLPEQRTERVYAPCYPAERTPAEGNVHRGCAVHSIAANPMQDAFGSGWPVSIQLKDISGRPSPVSACAFVR